MATGHYCDDQTLTSSCCKQPSSPETGRHPHLPAKERSLLLLLPKQSSSRAPAHSGGLAKQALLAHPD